LDENSLVRTYRKGRLLFSDLPYLDAALLITREEVGETVTPGVEKTYSVEAQSGIDFRASIDDFVAWSMRGISTR
jgi:hypothetical protein